MELFETRLNLADAAMSQAELSKAVIAADVLVRTVTDRIDSTILSQAGDNLKLIASFGTSIDHIDFAAAKKLNITVTHTPSVLTEDTTDMTMGLILAVPRRLSGGARLIRAKKWDGWGPARQSHLRQTTRNRGHGSFWASRGEVIDEYALAHMLAKGEIAEAGLYVFEYELAVNPKLVSLETFCCSHIWDQQHLKCVSIWMRR